MAKKRDLVAAMSISQRQYIILAALILPAINMVAVDFWREAAR
jgi:hypothetical protein